jgi:Putative quorum-sensing-regulated virulence factor
MLRDLDDLRGHYANVTGRREAPTTLPFGKHRGQALRDVPTHYLRWLVANATDLRPELREAVESELESR